MDFLHSLFSFPVALTTVPFLFFFCLMLLSLTTGLLEDWLPSFDSGEIDGELDTDIELDHHLLLPVGITKVPLVISLTCTFFCATIILFYLNRYLLTPYLSDLFYLVSALVLIPIALVAGLYSAAFLLKPLMPLLDRERAFEKINYIGLTGQVRSGRVTEQSGEIAITSGARENLLDVCCQSGEQIHYGDQVLVLAYQQEQRRYLVAKQ